MYRSYHDPNMTRAIARQDEALEDLIHSTRQVIRKHSTYLAHNNDSNNYNNHGRNNNRSKSRVQTQQQCTHHCCQSNTKPIQSKNNHQVQLPQQHKLQHHQQKQKQQQQQQQYTTKSRTKTWLNKIMPSKLQYETDDEVGLHDLKEKIHKQKSRQPPQPEQQLPHVKTTSRPMIIPSVSASPEKVVVVDVPAGTTVIFRRIDADDPNNKQSAAMCYITDMSIIDQLFGHVQLNGTAKAVDNDRVYKKISKCHIMQPTPIQTSNIQPNSGPSTSTSTSSSTTLLNYTDQLHHQPSSTSTKKSKGMTQYLTMPSKLNLKAQEFNYMDSDASTIDYRVDGSPSSSLSTRSSIYHNKERIMKHQRILAENNAKGWMR